jgi:MFS transporter, DHA1 family, inner membrane transport protein
MPTSLSPARARLALLALALGGFGIGSTEFVASGLLPEIAHALLPALDARSHQDAIAQAGWMISAYAAGVVVGAPTIAVLAARAPRRGLLVALVAAFVVGTLLSAVAPTFPLLIVARFVAALPHGAYFGIASLVAGQIMGPGKQGRGIAFVLGGLTIANVVGVPAVTFLGQVAGWRAAYLAVAAVFVLALVAILVAVPRMPGDPEATPRRELGGFRHGSVWAALLTGAVGFGGFFAVQSYIAPITTHVTGLPTGAVPIVLVVVGIGMTLGNFIGGPLSDHDALRAVLISFAGTAAGLLLVALLSWNPVGLFAGVLVFSTASSVLAVSIQTRLLQAAPGSQTLAAAANHSSLNLGNSLGALLGGAVIAAGYGYLAPAWLGLALLVPGTALALLSGWLERRAGRRPTTDTGPVPGITA